MPDHYILIDYENVQPKSLAMLQAAPEQEFRVMIFVGANQPKIPFELVRSMQALGDKGRYVQITGSGSNALDFHIAYYLGTFAARDADGVFHVISRDGGYDLLLKHMTDNGINASRRKDLFDLPWLSAANEKPADEQLAAVVENLKSRGNAKPRKVVTLRNTINSLFGNKLSMERLDQLAKDLVAQGHILINNEQVSYKKL